MCSGWNQPPELFWMIHFSTVPSNGYASQNSNSLFSILSHVVPLTVHAPFSRSRRRRVVLMVPSGFFTHIASVRPMISLTWLRVVGTELLVLSVKGRLTSNCITLSVFA